MNFLQTYITYITDIVCTKLDITEANVQKKVTVMVTTKCLQEVQKFIEAELEGDSLQEFRENIIMALNSNDNLLYLATILMYLEEIPQYAYLLEGRLVSLKTDILYKLRTSNDRNISTTN